MMTRIVVGDASTIADWACLRKELWPDSPSDEHRREIAEFLASTTGRVSFLALDDSERAVGFSEATLRQDYVNGCDTSPVAFLEALYVRPAFRRSGIAGALIHAVESWARDQGMTELASDAVLGNDVAQAVHEARGFEVTEQVVYFRKRLPPRSLIN